MAGITVHTTSPINPNSPSQANGTSPTTSTAAARYSPAEAIRRASQTPAAMPATSTIIPSPTYATAQPGSSAGPLTTSIPQSPLNAQPLPTATLPASSTLTTSSPPSPQSGGFPSPFYSEARRASIPPPPKAGEIPKAAAFYAPQYQGNLTPTISRSLSINTTTLPRLAPHQTQGTLPNPPRAQPPSATTSIATPTSLTQDLSHPPGYVQDSRASFSERPPELVSPISQNQSVSAAGHSRGRSRNGILDGGGGTDDMEDDEKGLWGTAVSWAKTVGEKVIEGEEEVWKRINGQK